MSEVNDYLADRLEGFERLPYRAWSVVVRLEVYEGHKAWPDAEDYRQEVLSLCERIATCNGAFVKETEARSEKRALPPVPVDTLALVLSSQAFQHWRAQAIREVMDLGALRTLGVSRFLRLASAYEALQTGRIGRELLEIVEHEALPFMSAVNGRGEFARAKALANRMRFPIETQLQSIDELYVVSDNGGDETIYVFEEGGYLDAMAIAARELSRRYGLYPHDVPSLMLVGLPARLWRGYSRAERHPDTGALDRVELAVPAHLEPGEVASLFAASRAVRGRPRTLGERSAALLEMQAKFALEGGQESDLKTLYERWHGDPKLPKSWEFAGQYRFNDALRLARKRLLRTNPVPKTRG